MIKPNLLSVIFRITDMWSLDFPGNELIGLKTGRKCHNYNVIETDLQKNAGLLFSSISIVQDTNKLHILKGVKGSRADNFIEMFNSKKTALLTKKRIQDETDQLEKDFNSLKQSLHNIKSSLRKDIYFSSRWREHLLSVISPHIDDIRDCLRRSHLDYIKSSNIAQTVHSTLTPIAKTYDFPIDAAKKLNQRFVSIEIQKWSPFFDKLETYELSQEQKIAAVTFEENTLLNAAAGSGKTSTVVARAVYMLAKGVQPNEIICLTFNSGAKDEIEERISNKVNTMLKIQPGEILDAESYERLSSAQYKKVDCKTFHGLGKSIVESYRGKRYPKHAISNPEQRKNRFKRALLSCIEERNFQQDWIWLQAVLRFPESEPSRFTSEYEYNEYLQSIYKKKQQAKGVLSLGTDKLVKSSQEVSISNWLYINGVEFEYERPFEEGSEYLGCSPSEAWIPDFTYKLPDGTYIVHEHFGLDKDGKAPPFFENPALYEKNAKEKQTALTELNALHFWTTSAQFYNESIFSYLEEQLISRGIKIKPRVYDDIEERLESIGQTPDYNIVKTAVAQIRANGLKRDELSSRVETQPNGRRAERFLNVCFALAERIDKLLSEDKQIDFDAMMHRAIEYLESDKTPEINLPPYRYFIVDEFQDTAPGRAKLVQLLRQRDVHSKLFVVGDDWQSINRFAGSDLNYFTYFGDHFNHLFENSDKYLELTETRRCPKAINNIARTFITSTGHLSNKRVVTKGNSLTQGVIDILSILNDNKLPSLIDSTLREWCEASRSQQVDNPGSTSEKPTVMILGRYSAKFINGISDEGYTKGLTERWSEHFDFLGPEDNKTKQNNIYLTAHTSKGLEADYILVIGLNDVRKSVFSFPSERETDPLLELVSPSNEPVPDAEDRRLFYVALTRAKKQVVLYADYHSPSFYVTTLLREHRDGSILFNGEQKLPEPCHRCDIGVFYREFPGKNGRNSYHRCSNQAGCNATKTIYREYNT